MSEKVKGLFAEIEEKSKVCKCKPVELFIKDFIDELEKEQIKKPKYEKIIYFSIDKKTGKEIYHNI